MLNSVKKHNPLKRTKLLILLIFFSTVINAQTPFKKNTVFLEAGGNGFFQSINYERQITRNPGLALRIGAGIYYFYIDDPLCLTIPVGLNYLINLKNHKTFLDVGFGITYTQADAKLYVLVDYDDPNFVNTKYYNYIPGIGFRWKTDNNFMWRCNFTPVINHLGFIPFFGFSFGKMF